MGNNCLRNMGVWFKPENLGFRGHETTGMSIEAQHCGGVGVGGYVSLQIYTPQELAERSEDTN